MTNAARLREALERDFPTLAPSSDRAWSRPPALRVIDCVLSLRRNYDRFVVPRLDRFEDRFPEVVTVRDLRGLVDTCDSATAFVKDALNYKDAQRAGILDSVIDFLLTVVDQTGDDSELERLEEWANKARPDDYRSVGIRGFALAGFQYLRMLFGANTTKPDVHICRYVASAVGHRVSDIEALNLLEASARASSIKVRDIDTTIWEYLARRTPGRRRRLTSA
jgi:hypothetical protein